MARCQQCGREFEGEITSWAYRRKFRKVGEKKPREHIFCSWSCLCAAQRESDEMYGVKPDKYEQAYENTRQRWKRRYEKRKKA